MKESIDFSQPEYKKMKISVPEQEARLSLPEIKQTETSRKTPLVAQTNPDDIAVVRELPSIGKYSPKITMGIVII